MSRLLRLAAIGCAVGLLNLSCGPAPVPLDFTITARPRTLDGLGQVSVITVTAVDTKGQPGKGTVHLTSTAGTFAAGVDTTLTNGTAEENFTCLKATDPACGGTIRITAKWSADGQFADGFVVITIAPPPDAGIDAGVVDAGVEDAGFDAGTTSPDAGSFDGGTFGAYRMSLAFEKQAMVSRSGDRMLLTATLTDNATGAVVPNSPVNFTSTGGSFTQTGPTSLTTTATTDSSGVATATIYVGPSLNDFLVTAAAFDATAYGPITVVDVNQVEWVNPGATGNVITVASTGRNSSTVVQFRVLSSTSMPVPGIALIFRVKAGSAAGATVTPAGTSNQAGVAQTTLNSAEGVGPVTIEAVVQGTEVTGVPNSGIRGESQAYSVIVGRPSDRQLNVQCARKSLGALETTTPPRQDQSTECTASIIDRNGNGIPFPVTVQWQSEQGNVTTPTNQDASNTARTTFRTNGNLPADVTPLAGEPTVAGRNPRDMFVTIIAAVGNGEEEFWDGSGSSLGVTNGRWDPGEWFVDLAEPFVDANDNQRYDVGEQFLDTDRVDCGNPTGTPTRNSRWDGPNGCWDTNITIWRSAHVVYTNALTTFTGVNTASAPSLIFSPPLPTLVPLGSNLTSAFTWYDPYFNRLSSDGSGIGVSVINSPRGSVNVVANVTGESFGHDLVYETVVGTESAPDSGVFTIGGTCNPNLPDAGYPLTRCLRQYRFAAWQTGAINGTLTFVPGSAQSLLPDGGVPPPTAGTFELRGSNSLQAGPSTYQFSTLFE